MLNPTPPDHLGDRAYATLTEHELIRYINRNNPNFLSNL